MSRALAAPLPLAAAARKLLAGHPLDDALGRAAGSRDAAALSRALERELRLGPAELSAFGRTGHYTLRYGGPFHVQQTLRYLARDPGNRAERVEGSTYDRYFPLDGRQVRVSLTLRGRGCDVAVGGRLSPTEKLALHGRFVRFLGLDQPLAAFARAVRGDAVMDPLVQRLRGVRVPQVPSLWEALCWAVMGQQINLAFAYRLRNRFIVLGNAAEGAADDAADASPLPFPEPEQVLRIPQPAWREAQFSRQKADYLQGLARAFAEGALTETELEGAETAAVEATLRAVRGLGPWSVAYGLLRALGRVDALPAGDAGLRAALRHHYGLAASPDVRQQEALMEPFRPYRGLATYYFWKSLDQVRQE